MRKTRFFALILVLVLCTLGTAMGVTLTTGDTISRDDLQIQLPPEQHRQIRVGMECDFAPNNWQEYEPTAANVPIENLEGFYADGYDVQISRIIAEQLGADLIVEKIAWGNLITALNEGEIDMIIAGMADTPERRRAILFSDPYRETEYAVMVINGSKYENATSIQDFYGASMLAQRDTKLDDVIDQIKGVNHLEPVDTVPNQLKYLAEGKCDATVINYENAPEYIAAYPNLKAIHFEFGKGFTQDFSGACVGIRKIDKALLRQVNAILTSISPEERKVIFNATVLRQPK